MDAFTLEFLVTLFPIRDVPVISIVDDNLTTLVGIVVQDLIFQFGFDSPT